MNNKKFTKYLILGAGLSGLSAAYFLKKDFLIIEKENRTGGLCKTESYKNFLFDYSGHLLHFTNKKIKNFVLQKLLKNKYIENTRKSFVYSNNKFVPFPYQNNLAYFDDFKIFESLQSFIKKKSIKINSLYDYFISNYGKKITNDFFMPYNTKLFKTDLTKLSPHQLGDFIPKTDIIKIIQGAVKKNITDDAGYNYKFYYPSSNGSEQLIHSFNIDNKKILFNTYPVNIDYKKKFVILNDKTVINYEYLISTIPLPEFLNFFNIFKNIKLDYVSVLNLNILLNSYIAELDIENLRNNTNYSFYKNDLQNAHWIYFPEKEYPFYRVGFYKNIAEYLVPRKNNSSLYVEISYKKNFKNYIIDKSIKKIIELKFIADKKNIISIVPQKIKYAFVLFDFATEKNLNKIRIFLKNRDIYLLGRYGNWEYSSMENNIKNAADLNLKIHPTET